ncbi:MAG: DUF3179 domain-containing protein [Clostridiales bacterium]|nr:DUF3179 domain-containing protein [Clostridiales bacterium]
MKKKLIFTFIFLITIIIIVVLILLSLPRDSSNTTASDTPYEINNQANESSFTELNNNLDSRLSKDSIPPIENPKYIHIKDIDFLKDSDKVFIMEIDDEVYIYPRMIMVWHEIINDVIGGESVSITYCPLTGSVIGYSGNFGGYTDNTYGTSGKLLNSNLVMYDRKTDSDIPQILGTAINSSLEGSELNTFPIYWTDWADAKTVYPDGLVLSIETGYQREYFMDPYGSYNPAIKDSYYTSGAPKFDVINENDGTFTDKKIITGVKYSDNRIAINPETVKSLNLIQFDIGDIEAIAVYDQTIKAVRVFSSIYQNTNLKFTYQNDKLFDNRGTVWNENGISENGEKLDPLTHFDVMWFAWYAYYPDTDVLK